jgi:cation diffusion facilitator CzcD-associated flavoprotein CzcO
VVGAANSAVQIAAELGASQTLQLQAEREDKVLPAENPRYGFSLVVKMDRLRKNTLAK